MGISFLTGQNSGETTPLESQKTKYALISYGPQSIITNVTLESLWNQYETDELGYNIVFQEFSTPDSPSWIMAQSDSPYSTRIFRSGGGIHIQYGYDYYNIFNTPYNSDTVYEIDVTSEKVIFQGNVYEYPYGYASISDWAYPLQLFTTNYNTPSSYKNSSIKLLSFKVYAGDILAYNFVPVPEGDTQYSDIPAPSNCLYETIRHRYYENDGSGEFGIEEID